MSTHCPELLAATFSAMITAQKEEEFDINIRPLAGPSFPITISKYNTISEVKAKITIEDCGFQQEKVILVFNGQKLNASDREVVEFFGIKAGDTLNLRIEHRDLGRGSPQLNLIHIIISCHHFDPSFDCDFTHLKPDGKKYMRGNMEYHRPYGWYRYALKVFDLPKYGRDNTWLGTGDSRVGSSAGEWPVSYHGTNFDCIEGIIYEGYIIGSRDKYGKGVYSCPTVEMAELFAKEFQYEGKKYKVVFQNRVNPALGHLKIMNDPIGIHYISPLQSSKDGVFDVRPYGILIKEI